MGRQILVIEDDKILRKACEVSLTKRGFLVVSAPDGAEGIRQAEALLPALVLLDMRMPKLSGMDTLALLKRNEKTRAIPVVVLSNSSGEAGMQQAEALGATGYLVKASLSLRELGDRVDQFLTFGTGFSF